MKKTKIICTLGPATDDREVLKQLITDGMDVARFNFSHGDHEEQKNRLHLLREVSEEMGVEIAALMDTKGPEIRTGLLKDGKKVMLREGQKFVLSTAEMTGDENGVYVNYGYLPQDVRPGDHILVDDGLIDLAVDETGGTDVVCTVINGGELGEQKGVNIPHVKTRLPALTDKDREDIRFGLAEGFDFIAASFVRSAEPIKEIREMVNEAGTITGIIAKIENEEGIDNLDEIIAAADGILIARGDMGVEVEAEKLPYIQKTIIAKCDAACKIVITATQMLDSMIRNPRPTRAEVSDVANAVYEGTDAVMLSGETANGKYPSESLETMVRIVEETEKHIDADHYRTRIISDASKKDISNAVCFSSVSTADYLDATAVIAPSITGYTVRLLSKFHPQTLLVGLSPSLMAVRKMNMYWGVISFQARREESTDALIRDSLDLLKDKGVIADDDIVVVTAGVISHSRRHEPATDTNIMRVVKVD